MLLSEFIREGTRLLSSVYPEREASAIVQRLCEDMLGTEHLAHILHPETCIPEGREEELFSALRRLQNSEPLQYVTGRAQFFGREFNVGRGVLIPRPETEQLVSFALPSVTPGAKVLDLCTGSGCIAWSIALECPQSSVVAVDLSAEALNIARRQFDGGENMANRPDFLDADVLDPSFAERFEAGSIDVLVSNPPYIMDSERALMRANVLDYEPSMALFVPDSDPLLFYKAIAGIAALLLKHGGTGYVEINESLGAQTAALFSEPIFINVEVLEDFFGKQRFVRFVRA